MTTGSSTNFVDQYVKRVMTPHVQTIAPSDIEQLKESKRPVTLFESQYDHAKQRPRSSVWFPKGQADRSNQG